jgi:proteasome accessory factor B
VKRLERLGAPQVVDDARSALRKLSHDLPIGPLGDEVTHDLVNPRTVADPRVFELAASSVARRKELRFTYRSMEKDVVAERRVRPYGVFYLGTNGYLVGHDLERDALRNFRLSRMRDVAVNAGRPNSPDFEVPESFDLRKHARSSDAWELGDADAVVVVVQFTGSSGYVDAARQLGEPTSVIPRRSSEARPTRDLLPDSTVPSPSASDARITHRRFHVRRQDVFARWLLSFAGDAIPVEPTEFVDLFRRLVHDTLALYERDA